MSIELGAKAQKLIRDRLSRGGYANVDQIVLAALASLDLQESLDRFAPGELDTLVAEGEADIERGDVLDGEQALRERRQRRAQGASKAG